MPATVADVTAPAPSTTDAPPGDDRCPGVVRPHDAQDGLLVRVRLVGGRLDAPGLRALARIAGLGNGIVELTSRANVQARGLHRDDLPAVTALLGAAGLLPSLAHDRVRGVLADPLAGRRPGARADAAEVDAVLDALDAGVCGDPVLTGLSGRFLVAVDDGAGATDVAHADLRLRATAPGRWSVEVDGRAAGAPLPAGDATALALDVARAFVARRLAHVPRTPGPGGGPAAGAAADRRWRIADLPAGAAAVVPDGTPLGPLRRAGGAAPASVGPVPERDGDLAIGALVPLGRLDPSALDTLAGLADRHPVRVSAARTVTVLDVRPGEATAVAERLRAVGLVDDPGSGWVGLSACAGAGACGKAHVDVRATAAARVAARRATGDRRREHWAACGRRCGDGPGVARSLAAREDGGWDVVERGEAGR